MWRSRIVALYVTIAASVGPAVAQGPDDPARTCGNSDPELRIRACTSIIESRAAKPPDLAEAYRNRGMAYGLERNLERAFADYDRAIEVDPGNPRGFLVRGNALSERKDTAGAIADYSRAIALDPNYVMALSGRAEAYRSARDYSHAIADYDRLIALEPDAPVSWVQRGAIKLEARQSEGALQDYDQAVKLAGQFAWPWTYRCWARGLSGRLQEALADCNAALRIDPADETGVGESAFANRGVIHLKRGEYDAAISDFDAALKNDPHLGRALYGRSVARRKKGNAKGSDADLAAAIAVYPEIAGEFDQWGLNDRAAPATASGK